MKTIKGYIYSALYNIKHNKSYAFFCIIGTALTFVFIIILLQLNYTFTHDTAPYINGGRTVHIYNFKNVKGESIGGIVYEELGSFINNLRGVEAVALSAEQYANIFTGSAVHSSNITFVNHDYWLVNQFVFLEGRPFNKDEYDNKKLTAVIKRSFADILFGKGKVLGKQFEYQGNVYTIVGVVQDYTNIGAMNSSNLWISNYFNKFVPDNRRFYNLYLLFPKEMSVSTMKDYTASAVKSYFGAKKMDIDISKDKISTVKEEKMRLVGNNTLALGIVLIILLLLIVPAINIITINVANIHNRSLEISIRRALGATIFISFIQLIVEELILVLAGTILGIILTLPFINLIENILLNNPLMGKMSLLTKIDFYVIFVYVLPISLLFTLLSGGIPAYIASKSNIAINLKGN